MPELKAFRGIRYSDSSAIGDLVCPPYDIIPPQEQQRLHDLNPHNAVRLELAMGGGTGPEGYGAVRDTFESWKADGVVSVEDSPALYVYRQDFTSPGEKDRRRVIGVIGALELEEFGTDSGVLPHERTMEGPKKDRLALLRALEMNVSPIYGIYRGGGDLDPWFSDLENRPTAARLADDQGILHRLWVITMPAEIEMLSKAVAATPLVIADGHHRYETALAYHREKEGATGEHGAIMCFCVDADSADLVVLPYNRAFKTSERESFISKLKEAKTRTLDDPRPNTEETQRQLAGSGSDHPFVFLTSSGADLIEIDDDEVVRVVGERAPAWRNLDVVALHEALLPRLLAGDPEELVFSKDPAEIARLVDDEGWDGGVLLKALGAAQIVDVARSGERMPQKASYFWPKALTGLVFRSLQG